MISYLKKFARSLLAPVLLLLALSSVWPASILLRWTASTDNVGVAGYNVYRNGTKIGTSATTSYVDPTAVAGTTYSYTVTAYDAAGNEVRAIDPRRYHDCGWGTCGWGLRILPSHRQHA